MPYDKMKTKSQGKKTHEQFLRMLERKDDLPKPAEAADLEGKNPATSQVIRDRNARQSEMPVSFRGMNQESRHHNKHNNPGQSGHKPQKHTS